MRNQNGGSRTDTLIKLVLIFFVSLLSFSVGTFVGKNFSDSKYKQAQLEGEFEGGARDTASIPADHLEVKPEEALTEKDIDQIANEFTKPEAINEATEREVASADTHAADSHATDSHATAAHGAGADHAEAAAPAHGKVNQMVAEPIGGSTQASPINNEHGHSDEKADLSAALNEHKGRAVAEVSSAAKNVAAGTAPGEAKKINNDPRAKELPTGVAASTVGKFTVQISSSLKQEEAEGEAQKLIAKGFSAFVVPADVNGKTWYRVSVGLFSNRAEAQNYRQKLMKESGVTTAIVQAILRSPASE